MEAAFVLARLGQLAAAMVLGGSSLFFLYGMQRGATGAWRRWMLGVAILGAVSTVAWLMVQSASFAESTAAAFDAEAVWAVASGASFGRAAAARLVMFLAAFVALASRRSPWVVAAGLGLVAAASFAWTGHGASDDGVAGAAHLGADVAHLVAAAIWLGALAPLAVLVGRCRGDPAPEVLGAAHYGLARFSGIGPAVVGVLALSGAVNSWFLIGPDRLGAAFEALYGQLLAAKLAMFAVMLALAAANRYRLAPRLAQAAGPGETARAVAALKVSVVLETVFGLSILAVVSWLGVLPPPVSGEG